MFEILVSDELVLRYHENPNPACTSMFTLHFCNLLGLQKSTFAVANLKFLLTDLRVLVTCLKPRQFELLGRFEDSSVPTLSLYVEVIMILKDRTLDVCLREQK